MGVAAAEEEKKIFAALDQNERYYAFSISAFSLVDLRVFHLIRSRY
jgi:hypothetical protein